MTARPLAPEADLAHVLDLAKLALQTGTMIDPETLLCDLLQLDEADLHVYLTDPREAAAWDATRALERRMAELGYFDTDEDAPDQSPEPLARASEGPAALWRQAEAGTVQHLVLWGRALCAADDAGPWRAVAGAPRCASCLELEDVLAHHG